MFPFVAKKVKIKIKSIVLFCLSFFSDRGGLQLEHGWVEPQEVSIYLFMPMLLVILEKTVIR